MVQRVDVCVLGAGIVGSSFAAALSRSPAAAGLRLALIDSDDLFAEPERRANVISNRVSSIAPSSQRFLSKIGVWELIDDARRKGYNRMQVWDGNVRGRVNFVTSPPSSSPAESSEDKTAPVNHANANSPIAWIVENNWLRHSVISSLGKDVNIFNKTKVLEIEKGVWPRVKLSDGSQIECRLLVGADGANSLARQYAKIDSTGWDYPNTAIVATLDIESLNDPENVTAYQRFLSDGPIALLPLSPSKSSLVWSTTPALAAKLAKLPDEVFARLVDVALRNPSQDLEFLCNNIRNDGSISDGIDLEAEAKWGLERNKDSPEFIASLPKISGVVAGSRAGFPLKFRMSKEYISDRVALIGDAAHTIHPLAGQGLNLGLADAECLANVIERGVLDGQDIGFVHTLQDYAAERFPRNLGMMVAVDGISRLFRAEFEPIVWARSFGLNFVNSISTLKKIAMRAAY